ncbi:hypothetical protein [Thermodesulfovibrio yellowstonii]|uniref:hypothetical protein n=1 Tax=Thermodesulfovibrio yellowstonii TaxID=28262 RepID=UPI0024B32183|nr:hypothetical protein [Thermodesulfovibrio yellowstonii]MDI6865783.1 hypothetical protein [Thermodesulfovibrio yellowstonii]
MKNIELFDRYASVILSRLYEKFPCRDTVFISEIASEEIDPEQELTTNLQIARETFIWLALSGYLMFEKDNYYAFQKAVLTERGLRLLNEVPDSLKSKKTLGERLVNAIKVGAQETAREILRKMISRGVGE